MATSTHPKCSSIFKILCDALLIVIKNWKPLLVFILLISILSVLPIFNSLLITPILADLTRNFASISKLNPQNPEFYRIVNFILTELREITIIDAIFYVTSFIISTLILTSTICFVCMTYTEKQPTLRELLCRIKKIWKGTMVTQVYATIFSQMSGLLMFLLIGGFILVSMNSVGFLVSSFILTILALILRLYLGIILSFSVVVAVKEGIYGLAAIVRAVETMKGRRRQGILIALLIMLAIVGVFVAYFFLIFHHPLSEMQRVVVGGIFLTVVAVLNFFDLTVVVVFYFDCKQNDGGLLMLNKCDMAYSILPAESSLLL